MFVVSHYARNFAGKPHPIFPKNSLLGCKHIFQVTFLLMVWFYIFHYTSMNLRPPKKQLNQVNIFNQSLITKKKTSLLRSISTYALCFNRKKEEVIVTRIAPVKWVAFVEIFSERLPSCFMFLCISTPILLIVGAEICFLANRGSSCEWKKS